MFPGQIDMEEYRLVEDITEAAPENIHPFYKFHSS